MTRRSMRQRAILLAALSCLLLVGCAGVRSYLDAARQIERLGCSGVGISSASFDGATSLTVTCTTSLREPAAVMDLQLEVLRVVWRTVPGAITSVQAYLRDGDGDVIEPTLRLSGRDELVERLGPRDPDLDRRKITDGAGQVVGGVLGGVLLTGIVAAVVVLVLVRRSRRRSAAGPVQGWGYAGGVPGQLPWAAPGSATPVARPPTPPPPTPPPGGPAVTPPDDIWRSPG